MRLVIVTGISGAGKSVALRSLEDLGFFAVDNLPVPLTNGFVQLLVRDGEFDKAAIAIDIRNADFLNQWAEVKKSIEDQNHTIQILFLEADRDVILNRFKATRRPHPLGGMDLLETITNERKLLKTLRDDVTWVLDTSDLTVHELRGKVFGIFNDLEKPRLIINVCSFGFSSGLPMESDLVFDVRFLPNPYFISSLRELTGKDRPVGEYIESKEIFIEFYSKLEDFIIFLIPQYEKEGKSYLSINIGCTGGKHRSVYTAEKIASTLRKLNYKVSVNHRDIYK